MTILYNQNPNNQQGVEFILKTPDSNGCFLSNPYQITNITIYFISRNFTSSTTIELEKTTYSNELNSEYIKAKELACSFPTQENLSKLQKIETEIAANSEVDPVYFNEAVPVLVLGNKDNPAWLSTSTIDSQVKLIEEDEEGNQIFGTFSYIWNPYGQREGDYFITWSWAQLQSGETISSQMPFYLNGNTKLTTSIPTHQTKTNKYETLLAKYMPNMFSTKLSDDDVSPYVLRGFNNSVAKVFTLVEDLANQMGDNLDPNVAPESTLNLLANYFNTNLRTEDPTLWRRQIIRSIPLYKKKGTLSGVTEALAQSNIKLNRLVPLWQIMSKYTFQESFFIENDELIFNLSKKIILPNDLNNFNLYYREDENAEWIELSQDYVTFQEDEDGKSLMIWVGDNLSINPLILENGNEIRVLYKYNEIPNENEQLIETYIRSLELTDLRNSKPKMCPKKNWNVRAIEKTDAIFDIIVPVKNPFYNHVVFGKVRTEFPYGENIYNMDEYNGSKRDSTDPCDIDCDFLDECHSCLGSLYNIYVEIESLSDDRISEVNSILTEFMPFNTTIHSVNITGVMNDFILPQNEILTNYVKYTQQETFLIDPPQTIFNRTMEAQSIIKRNELANVQTASSGTATCYNENIKIYSIGSTIDKNGVSNDPDLTLLEVIAPSVNAGNYKVENIQDRTATVIGTFNFPLNEEVFTYRISNELIRKNTLSIFQENTYLLFDKNVNFYSLGVNPSEHRVHISGYGIFNIISINTDGKLSIENNGSIVSALSNVTYSIIDENDEVLNDSTTGFVSITNNGRVEFGNGTLFIRGISTTMNDVGDISNLIFSNNNKKYFMHNGVQYLVSSVYSNNLIIENYQLGNIVGVTGYVYERIIDNSYGNFGYNGLSITTSINEEQNLGILNGENAPLDENAIVEDDLFKENFIVVINDEYFTIKEIDGTNITLNGPMNNWTMAGTSAGYTILKYIKNAVEIPERKQPDFAGHTFDFIDRRGNEVFEINTEEADVYENSSVFTSLMNKNDSDNMDVLSQKEKITFTIEWI